MTLQAIILDLLRLCSTLPRSKNPNMKTSDTILAIQTLLGIPEAKRNPNIGPMTRAALAALAAADPNAEWPPVVVKPPTSTGFLREISPTGLALVKHFESCLRSTGDGWFTSYDDGGGVLTIGWGHTGLQHNDGTVFLGREITQAEADELLAYDMHQFEARVAALVKVPLTDDQHAALVSFDFNTGGLTLTTGGPSTLLRLLNQSDYAGASNEFPKWCKDNGRVVQGLVRRRAAERALFESDSARLAEFTHGEVELTA